MGELTPDEVALLRRLAALRNDEVCPNCGSEWVDPLSKNGWGVRCDARRERALESKRAWWSRNRGANAVPPDDAA